VSAEPIENKEVLPIDKSILDQRHQWQRHRTFPMSGRSGLLQEPSAVRHAYLVLMFVATGCDKSL